MSSSKQLVRYGNGVVLSGEFPGARDRRVEIRHWRSGQEHWRLVKYTRTGVGGGFRERVRPERTGLWRAQLADDSPALGQTLDPQTDAIRIRVRSLLNAQVSRHHVVRNGRVQVSGRVLPGGLRRRVVVLIDGQTIGTRTRRDGRFEAAWRPSATGEYRVRVAARRNRNALGSRDRAGRVTVYRPAHASWYGPGFYGNRTACGQTLTQGTVGVAHKSMPCGTALRLRYHGRDVAVRVIDRGPYVAGREFDLTYETKRRLGFGSTGTVLSSR